PPLRKGREPQGVRPLLCKGRESNMALPLLTKEGVGGRFRLNARQRTQIRSGAGQAQIRPIKRMRVASQRRLAIAGVPVAPDAQRAVGMIGKNLLARMIQKLPGQRDRPADASQAPPTPIQNLALLPRKPAHQFMAAVAVQVCRDRAVDAERQRIRLARAQIERELIAVEVEPSVRAAGLMADADRHRDVFPVVLQPRDPAHVYMALLDLAPEPPPGRVETDDARRGRVIALPAGVDTPPSFRLYPDRLHDVRMPAIHVPVGAEAFRARIQAQTPLAPQQFVRAVPIYIHDRTHMAAARTRRLLS